MHADLVEWGFVHIRSYGLMLVVAFLAGTALGLREARRRGLDEDRVMTVILVTLLASVAGARLLYVIEHIDEFRLQWTGLFALWEGGLTLYGGIVAGAVAGLLAARRLGLPMWSVADALAPSVALGTMFGRVGCFLNGCCYGRPTSLPWGVVYPPESYAGLEFGALPIHPAQLYAAVAGLAVFLVLWSLRRRLRAPGLLFWTFVLLFAPIRAAIDVTRAYESRAVLFRIGAVGVTESQLVSLALAAFALLMIVRLRRADGVPAPLAVP